MIIAVENVMAVGTITMVDLGKLAQIPGISYVPKRFSAAMYTIIQDDTKVSISIYPKSITSMGSKSKKTAIDSIHGSLNMLKESGVDVSLVEDPSISNLTCVAYPEVGEACKNLDSGVEVSHFKARKIQDANGATLMVYPKSSKVIITGVKTMEQATTSIRRMFDLK